MKLAKKRFLRRKVNDLAARVRAGDKEAEVMLRKMLNNNEVLKTLKTYVKDANSKKKVKISSSSNRKTYGPPLQGGAFGLGRSRKN